MPRKTSPKPEEDLEEPFGISAIGVGGFKSIRDRQTIEIRPLTILAGANSSGKSSIMQPLLLMKQTLQATFDPGIFLLDGPNVKFTSADQMFSKNRDAMTIELQRTLDSGLVLCMEVTYSKKRDPRGIDISLLSIGPPSGEPKVNFRQGMSIGEFVAQLPGFSEEERLSIASNSFSIEKYRCLLRIAGWKPDLREWQSLIEPERSMFGLEATIWSMVSRVAGLIHVPGLRSEPARRYQKTAAGPSFPDVFAYYVASVVNDWQLQNDERQELLGKALEHLELTWKIEALPITDAHVELHVPRMKKRSKTFRKDMVNIADVGLGVSQALPVLVALLVAEPGQMVYIEQPEIHLHPRAQVAMARILADAAKRGVRVVAETHSSLLLLGIQTLVAEGYLAPDLVKLHWFQLDKEGFTKITNSDLDEAGRFDTDWPEDFGAVELEAQSRYLDESEKRLAGS